MADIVWRTPDEMQFAYDVTWFHERMAAVGFTQEDIFGSNPPTLGLLLGPLLAQGWSAVLAFPRVYGAYLLWGWLLWQLWPMRREMRR
jgi:hypothetical protein